MKTETKYEFPLLDSVVTGSVMFAMAAFTATLFFSTDVLGMLT